MEEYLISISLFLFSVVLSLFIALRGKKDQIKQKIKKYYIKKVLYENEYS